MALTREQLDGLQPKVQEIQANEIADGETAYVRELDSDGIDAVQAIAKKNERGETTDTILVDTMVQILLSDQHGVPLYPADKSKTLPKAIKRIPFALKQRIIAEGMDFNGMSEDAQDRMKQEMSDRPLAVRGSGSRVNGAARSKKRKRQPARVN